MGGNRQIITGRLEDIAISGDAYRLKQLIGNLVDNALKYTPAGGEICIVVTPSPSGVRVEVTDDGPGIAPEYHERIFEKFGQVDDPQSHLGTGLGLTFCKLAVEAHGGRIGVESAVGRGSTFWLVLPRSDGGLPLPPEPKL